MRSILSIATIAGAALLVSACGGGAANNTANAPVVDNGTMMSNDVGMAPDMNAPMPTDNVSMNSTTTTTTTPSGNTVTTTTNTTNAM